MPQLWHVTLPALSIGLVPASPHAAEGLFGPRCSMEHLPHLTEGIFSGPSTGANLVAALAIARRLGPGHRVVTIQVDSGLKYLAGRLYSRPPPCALGNTSTSAVGP
ncbi:MAG: hypothetical protein ABJA86_09960 [Nocardioidaceae bacterium]